MALIREDPDTFAGLISETARRLSLDPALVEKDYWAVQALRAVREGIDVPLNGALVSVSPVFKGGTSLSKAFGLIQRFSEDVDLLVPLPVSNPKDYSANQRADVMKAITAAVAVALGIEGERKAGRRGVDCHWLYPYTSVATTAVEVEPRVVVELTVMGGQNPQTQRDVTSMVAEVAATIHGFPEYDDLETVQAVPTLSPERTLVEKLAMLHNSACQALEGQERRLEKAGRHYYDIARLLEAQEVRERISSTQVAQIAADADSWSALGGFPFTPRPSDGFAASPAFLDERLREVVAASYEEAMAWVWGDRPSLDRCVSVVAEHADLL